MSLEELSYNLSQLPQHPGLVHGSAMREGARHAAVLVLISRGEDPSVVLIERAASLRKHAGQIAFPGGEIDPGDRDAADAAIRETWEEIGLPPQQVQVLGELAKVWVAASRFWVTPVVGTWEGAHSLTALHRGEVAVLHQVPLEILAEPAHRLNARHVSGYIGPAFEIDDLFIWGFTAQVLNDILTLGGWSRRWDHDRIQAVPQRFYRSSG